jgi:Uma2 family endonuclease
MTTTATKLLTAEDLLRLYSEGVRGELIRGVLHRTMSTGQQHGQIVTRLVAKLFNFVDPRGLGTLVASDSGVLIERDPDTVREPDIAFTSADKIPLNAVIPGYAEAIPDLVVEVVSPNDDLRQVNDKARMWLSHGVRLVWVVYPQSRTIGVHHRDQPVATLTDDDDLDGLDVLPDFAVPVSALFGP